MAIALYVEEHLSLIKDINGELVQSPAKPVKVHAPLSISGTKATSDPVQEGTKFLYLSCDTACQFLVGPAPLDPATNGRFLPANGQRYVACEDGDSVAVIQQQ